MFAPCGRDTQRGELVHDTHQGRRRATPDVPRSRRDDARERNRDEGGGLRRNGRTGGRKISLAHGHRRGRTTCIGGWTLRTWGPFGFSARRVATRCPTSAQRKLSGRPVASLERPAFGQPVSLPLGGQPPAACRRGARSFRNNLSAAAASAGRRVFAGCVLMGVPPRGLPARN